MTDQTQSDPAAPADFMAMAHDEGGDDTEGHGQSFVGEPDAGPQNATEEPEGFRAAFAHNADDDDTEGHLKSL